MYKSFFPAFLTIKDAARKYDIDIDRLRRLIATGQVMSIQPFGRATPRLIPEESLTKVVGSAKLNRMTKTADVDPT